MTASPPDAQEILTAIGLRVDDLRKKVDGLEAEYETASGDVHSRAASDLNYLHQARQEAERLLTVIRGGSLFGRYHADADEHARAADRWRRLSLLVLLLWVASTGYLLYLQVISTAVAGLLIVPFLTLFFYCSLESNGHRRREANRRRIALRMAAVEAYMAQRLSDASTQVDAMKVMDEFIRQHFILPELDQTDVPYLGPGPKFSLLHITTRDSRRTDAPPPD